MTFGMILILIRFPTLIIQGYVHRSHFLLITSYWKQCRNGNRFMIDYSEICISFRLFNTHILLEAMLIDLEMKIDL